MRRSAAALLLLLTAGLAGCSGGSEASPQPETEPTAREGSPPPAATGEGPRLRYVALGDSFTAAPGLPGSSLPCLRSEENYPALVADALSESFRVTLDDRSCIGADTSSLASPQELGGGPVPPQAAAVDRRTDLVTVSVGGNDDEFFTRLLTGCLGIGGTAATACDTDALGVGLPATRERLAQAVADVRRRAPDAQVLVVGYPQSVPPRGTCPGLPESPGTRSAAREAAQALGAALAGAAADAGVGYVDVARASRGHDLCSDDPWVNGAGSDPSGAIPFHPLPAEQEAVADLVVAAVTG